MSAVPMLRAHQPDETDLATTDNTFRCDNATVRMVLDWFEQDISRTVNSTSANAERCRNRRICRETMGNRLITDCKPFHLLAFINSQLDADRSNWTRRRWNNAIQFPFNEAERLGLIVKNPFRGLSFEEGGKGRDWTDEELSKILGGANFRFSLLILGLRLSGLRPHEGCELQWPQIHRADGCIKIDHHKTLYLTEKPRFVPLNTPLIDLFEWIKKQNYPGDHVFPNTKGKPWTRTHADTTFRLLREKLGLPKSLKLHGCRHTFGTNAALNNVELAIVGQILGHGDINSTKRYVHLENKMGRLVEPMNKAVASEALNKEIDKVTGKGRASKPEQPTPLFDGLE